MRTAGIWVALLGLSGLGCATGRGDSRLCSPAGARVECTCPGGGAGEQTCMASGRLSACTCIGDSDASGTDASRLDAGTMSDAGAADAAMRDAGATDAGGVVGMDAGGGGMDAGGGGMDAGGAARDGGYDAGRDAGYDAGRDAGYDAGRDAGNDAGRDAGAPAAVGCLDGTVEVTWSATVVACGGPTQIWQTYFDNPAAYCSPGWTIARSHIVNDYLTRPGYAADVLYAFDGEGCEGWVYATRFDGYSQSRGGCGWLDSHHWSVGRPPGGTVQGIVCERP